MALKFRNEILEQIKNPDNVNCIFTIKCGALKRALVVHLANGEIELLTVPQSFMTFPYMPTLDLQYELGEQYLDNFALAFENDVMLNKKNLMDMTIKQKTKHSFDFVAHFKNGKSSEILGSWDRKWLEVTKQEIIEQMPNEKLVEQQFVMDKTEPVQLEMDIEQILEKQNNEQEITL